MALNISQIRTLVQSISGLTIGNDANDDVTQNVVDTFIQEGYQRIVSLDNRFPWFQSSYTFDGIVNQHQYSTGFTRTLPSTESSITFDDISEIISVTNETNSGNKLIYIDNFKAETVWTGTNDIAGIPAYFSLWAGTLQIWPKPDSVYTFTVRGYRKPSYEWLTDTGQNIDLNDEFHIMLVNFVVARLFQFQEDPQMAQVYMGQFESGIILQKDSLMAPNSNQPLILSGGFETDPYSWQRYMSNLAIRAVSTGEWS
jgi:hypothetical protein